MLYGRELPGFTRLLMDSSQFLLVPPLLALAYCVYVWVRKSHGKNSWIGFFATTTAVLIFITLPTIIAVLLPLIAFAHQPR